jgi:hypothetical protein
MNDHELKIRFSGGGLVSLSEFCEWVRDLRMPGEDGSS